MNVTDDENEEQYRDLTEESEMATNEVPIVDLFISTTFSPEMREILYYADMVFDKFKSGQHLAEVEYLLLEVGGFEDPSALKYQVLAIYEDSLKDALAAFGIVVPNDCKDYKLLAQMLDTLALAQYHYEKEFILPLLNFDEFLGGEETFAELVNTLTGARTDDVLEVILSFKDRLLINLKDIVTRGEDDPLGIEVESESSQVAINRYRRFLNGRRFGIIYNLTRKSVGYGNFEWMELYLLVEDLLADLKVSDLQYELVSLILISKLDLTNEDASDTLDMVFSKLANIYCDKPSEALTFKKGLMSLYYGEN